MNTFGPYPPGPDPAIPVICWIIVALVVLCLFMRFAAFMAKRGRKR